jgi:hypothetical protein
VLREVKHGTVGCMPQNLRAVILLLVVTVTAVSAQPNETKRLVLKAAREGVKRIV